MSRIPKPVFAAVAIVAVVVALAAWRIGRVERIDVVMDDIPIAAPVGEPTQPGDQLDRPSPTPLAGLDHASVLIVGTDDRTDLDDLSGFGDFDGARADVVIQAVVDGGRARLISIPRDLFVGDAPCSGDGTRVAMLLEGCDEASGPSALVSAVQSLTGIRIEHYVEVDFAGFVDVVDRFGGYRICLANPVRDVDAALSLPAGCTDADGETTLSWLRSRKTQELVDGRWRTVPGANDLLRATRQRVFLTEMLDQVTALSPLQTVGVFDSMAEHLRVDSGLGVGEVVDLALLLRDIDEIAGAAPPVRDETIDGRSYLVPTIDVAVWVSELDTSVHSPAPTGTT